MAITPEMARAELMRRRGNNGISSGITPQLAQAELERRGRLKQEKAPEEPREEGFVDYAKRGLARGARNSVAGVLDNLDFLATPIREGINLGAQGLEKLGLIEEGKYRSKPLGEETAKGIDTLTGGYTAPRNHSEKTGESIGRGLMSLPTGFGLGTAAQGLKYAPKGMEALGGFLKGSNVMTPTNIAATGASAGLMQSVLNENPEDIPGAIGAGFAGGIGVPVAAGALSLLTGKGRQAAAARTGEFFKINPEAVETFEKAGITPTLADVSRGKVPKLITSKLEHLPGAAEPIREAKELQRSQILEALEQGNVGKGLSKEEAGKLATKGARKYQTQKNQQFSESQKKFDQDVDTLSKSGKDMVSTTSVNDFFDKEIFSKFKDPLQKELFEQSPLGKEYKRFYEASQKNGGKLPYHALKDFLDHVRDKITTFGEIGSASQGKLKQFSKNIVNDIERDIGSGLKELGQDSYKNWKNYRKNYSVYKEEVVPKLNEIYKKDKKSGTDAFIDLITSQKKGAEKPGIVLKGLDHAEQLDLTNAVHKHIGSNKDGTFSPLKWAREFNGLSPESKKVILSPLNESSRKKVQYIADSIGHLKSTLAEANTSKTAYHAALGALGIEGARSLVSFAGGNPIPAAKLATGLFIGNRISDQVLTNPKFINWMYKGMKAKDFNHFERNLNRVPNVGKFTRGLTRSVQTFQNDLSRAQEETKNKEK